jgi:hypothetical protein
VVAGGLGGHVTGVKNFRVKVRWGRLRKQLCASGRGRIPFRVEFPSCEWAHHEEPNVQIFRSNLYWYVNSVKQGLEC